MRQASEGHGAKKKAATKSQVGGATKRATATTTRMKWQAGRATRMKWQAGGQGVARAAVGEQGNCSNKFSFMN